MAPTWRAVHFFGYGPTPRRESPTPTPKHQRPRREPPASAVRRTGTRPRTQTRAALANVGSTFPASYSSDSLFHSPTHAFDLDVHADPLRTRTPVTIDTA